MTDGPSLGVIGALVLALAAGIALRTWRPFGSRD